VDDRERVTAMSREFWERILQWIIRNWTGLTATIAVVGFLTSSLIPVLQEYTAYFIFLWGVAVLITLFEIKGKLCDDLISCRYANMREARPHILSHIRTEMAKKHKSQLSITIVGGRIRTISDMLREIRIDIESGQLKASNVKFTIFTMHPDFVKSWNFSGPDCQSPHEQRNRSYAEIITNLTNEITNYNTISSFSKNKIKTEILHYREYPHFYCYLIGESMLYWGPFTWEAELQDFHGPSNSCFYLDNSMLDFAILRSWFFKRTQFFSLLHNMELVNQES